MCPSRTQSGASSRGSLNPSAATGGVGSGALVTTSVTALSRRLARRGVVSLSGGVLSLAFLP